MMDRFTVLASGSAGNASLLEVGGFGLLIDCGLQPRALTHRLRAIGASWENIQAVILTHTHGDHWKDLTLADLRSRRIPIYAHASHLNQLAASSKSYETLAKANLTRTFAEMRPLSPVQGLIVRPIPVSHDSEPTFAFRFDRIDGQEVIWSVGYASDLGCGSAELIDAFAGVDVLALEYNHDLRLEERSRRPRFLIDRVLSDRGHLSNCQAAELTKAIAARSGEGFPRHLVQLHLSRECNRPTLASEAGRASLATLSPQAVVVTATQDIAAQPIPLHRKSDAANRTDVRNGTALFAAIGGKPRADAVNRTGVRNGTADFKLATGGSRPSLPGFDD